MSGLIELLATTSPRPLTIDDLSRLPDDGWRYELVDGSLIVSPPPRPRHQVAATRLVSLLLAGQGSDFDTLTGGAGILLHDETFLIPDVIVVRADADLALRGYLTTDVVLAVEVVSPSNASTDLVLKRAVYARYGIAHYWIVDTRAEPRITVLELDASRVNYRVAHEVGPGESVRLERPFAVTLTPAELV